MADKIVEVPGVGNVAFPDTMSDDQISAALQKQTGSSQPAAQPAQPERTGVSGFAGNLMESTGRFAKGLFNAAVHPIDTTVAAHDLATGIVGHAINSVVPGFITGGEKDQALAKAVKDEYVKRYGGVANVLHTAYTDPVGLLSDLSMVAGGVAGAAGKTADLARAGELANTINEARGVSSAVAPAARAVSRGAQAVSEATNPLVAAGKVAATVPATAGLPEASAGAANYLYRTALHPRSNTPIEDVNAMVKTGLSGEIPVSQAGLEKLSGLIDDVNQKIRGTIGESADQGQSINRSAVLERLKPVEQRAGMQVAPEADLKAINKVGDQFVRTNDEQIPVVDAQAKKIGTYQAIKSQYGSMSPAAIEAQKALARGIKEELVTAMPELANLNDKESKFLNLQGVLEKAVTRAANSSGGLQPWMAAGTAGAATHSLGLAAVAGFLREVVAAPEVRSRLAIALNKAHSVSPAWKGTASLATAAQRINDYLSSLSPASPSSK